MKISKTLKHLVLVFSLFSIPYHASAGEVTAQLSATINEFVNILTNTPVAELRSHGLPEQARKLIFARFDFSEMTKRSLGRHWRTLNQAEQGEFVEVLTERLLVSYGKTVRSYGGEKIQFKREIREGKLASVETKVNSGSSGELPIDYRLHDVDGEWRVYDVSIDNVSMVNNFRAQFNRVIARSSVRDLLQKLKDQSS